MSNVASSPITDSDKIISDEIIFSPRESSPVPEISDINFGTRIESLTLFSKDWSSVFGQKQFTDVNVVLQSDILPCHKIVFLARCPDLLKDVNALYKPNVIDLSHYSSKGTKAFLEYIYTGRTDSLTTLNNEESRDISVLAKKYNLKYLHSLIKKSFVENDCFYSRTTRSPPHYSINKTNLKEASKKSMNVAEDSIILSDGSSEESYTKPNCSQRNISTPNSKLLNLSRPFGFLSTSNTSPDLFDTNLRSGNSSFANSSNTSSQSKRKLDCSQKDDEFKKKCIQAPKTTLGNLIYSPDDIVTIDTNSEDSHELKSNNDIVEVKLDNSSDDFHSSHDGVFEDINFPFKLNEESTVEANEDISNDVEDNKFMLSSNNHQSPSNILDSPLVSNSKKLSLEKYFETTFPSFNEDLIDVKTATQRMYNSTPDVSPRSTASNNEARTPDPDVIIKEATPLANYSDMTSPLIKAELAKYGLKQNLGPQKAKILLRYIYDQLHRPVDQLPSGTPKSSKSDSDTIKKM